MAPANPARTGRRLPGALEPEAKRRERLAFSYGAELRGTTL